MWDSPKKPELFVLVRGMSPPPIDPRVSARDNNNSLLCKNFPYVRPKETCGF